MFRTRRRQWLTLAILAPALMMAVAACLILGAANSSRSRFDRLQEGMTVAEASQVLGRDLESYCILDISGVLEDYLIENTIGIFPIDEIRIGFGCGRLTDKRYFKTPPTLFWPKVICNARKLLGR